VDEVHDDVEMVTEAIESFSVIGPDGWKGESPELLQYVSPAVAHGAMNSVVRARFPLGEMDAKIDAALRPYIEMKRNCWWMIGPNSTHREELKSKLIKRCFELEHEAFGLSIRTDRGIQSEIGSEMDPSITCEKITPETLEDYICASNDGNEPQASTRNYYRWLMKTHGERLELFISRVHGEPAGTGIIQRLSTSANLLSGFVRPKFRGMGAYQILIQARLARLREVGVPVAVVLSKAQTSAPILMRMGFEKVCSITTLEMKFSSGQ
jgi:hypothetical protein